MAKRVAVIDIGSNSIRMAIFERTSRFAFHLLHEAKSKVRISQNAYQNSGNLQKDAMDRTFFALCDFLTIAKSFKVKKTLCVATSALRDAPNRSEFLSHVKKELSLNIKIIDGEKEAFYGAIACANLLPNQSNALSIDIGGGSTEFAVIKNKNVESLISLDLGTVRLKELYFDTADIDGAISFIDSRLEALDSISVSTLIGIGGSFRAIAQALISHTKYPLKKIHSFESTQKIFLDFIEKILDSNSDEELKKLYIKSDRFDVIKPGALILQRVIKKFSLKNLISSGVGVREGLYLSDLLRNSNNKFPEHYNTSVRYLFDRYVLEPNHANEINKLAKDIFDLTHTHLQIPKHYRHELAIAAKLYLVGTAIHFYSRNKHSYYLIQSALEYGFTHKQIALIATLTRYGKRKFPSTSHYEKYKMLLPKKEVLDSLSYILSLSLALLSHKPRNRDFNISFKGKTLEIESNKKLFLAEYAMVKLPKLKELDVVMS